MKEWLMRLDRESLSIYLFFMKMAFFYYKSSIHCLKKKSKRIRYAKKIVPPRLLQFNIW